MKKFLEQIGEIIIEHLRHTTSSRFKLSLYFGFLGFLLALAGKLTTEFVALASVIATFYNVAKSLTDYTNNKNNGGK